MPRISVTRVLIGVNILIYLAMVVAGVSPVAPTSQDLVKWGASYGPYELSGEWWRVFTAMFVHIGVIHILLNMLCLSNLGPLAERLFGPRKFLALYVMSGVGGNVLSVGLHPQIVAAGASGAIFGIAGTLLALVHLRNIPALATLRDRMGRSRGLGVGGFIVYNLVYGFANSGIDNAAHIGGLVIGCLIGLTVPIVGSDTGRAALRQTYGVLLATALGLGAGFVGVRRLHGVRVEVETARRELIAGDDAAASERLQRILHDRPRDVEARALLGAVYNDQGRQADAIRELEIALRDDSTNIFVLANLGSAHWRLKQWDEAARLYAREVAVDSTEADAWANLGGAYINGGHAAQAVAPLQRAVKLQGDTARNHYALGLAYTKTKQYALAIASFQRALRLKPDDPLALLQRGYAYELAGQRDSARADYQRVLSQPAGAVDNETSSEARRLLGLLQRR